MDKNKINQKDLAHANGDPCDDFDCQECCSHDEHDHFICLDCGLEMDITDWYDEDYNSDEL